MDHVLEIAAYVLAAVVFILLLVLLARTVLAHWVQTVRFRRSLKRLDVVADRWAMELQPPPRLRDDGLASDPTRRPRRPEADV
jgi:hypothetical protein